MKQHSIVQCEGISEGVAVLGKE